MNWKPKLVAIAIVLMTFAANQELMAVKKVPKSGADSATAKSQSPETKARPSKTPEGTHQPPPPPEPAKIEKDNFIDADGDGINDNFQKSKPPEIKRDKAGPRENQPQPKKEAPPERQKPKSEEQLTKKIKR